MPRIKSLSVEDKLRKTRIITLSRQTENMRKKMSEWWKQVTWTKTWTGMKEMGSSSWSATKRLPWRYVLSFAWFAPALEKLVSIVLKLGTLLLVILFLVFVVRLFKNQGYVIQEFSVPKQLEEQGYNGEVMAIRLQDKLLELKEQAGSVKADSLELKSNDDDIDLSVLGVGLSLRTLAFQIREALGRQNKTLRGEVTRIDNRYEAQIRMTGFPSMKAVVLAEPGRQAEALDQLFKELAEDILYHTDPYRLALLLRKEKRYDEAITTIRHLLRTNDQEAHWGYLGWGVMLKEQRNNVGAIEKFEKAIEVAPDFSLAYVNLAYTYLDEGYIERGIETYEKAVALDPTDMGHQNSLAWIYHNNGKAATADSLYSAVLSRPNIDTEDRNEMALGWAEMRFQREDIMGAKEVLDTYVEMDGENVFSYLIKGVLAFSEQDTLSAYEHFKDAYELDPASELAINSNIGFAQLVGDDDHVLHVYRTADWSVVNAGQVASTFNQVAMQYNRMEEHDSAMVVIKRAIAIDTLRATPYTTLAETLYFQGHVDSFYYYTEKALQLGFNTKFYDYDEAPYDYFKDQLEFQRLLRKYRKEGNEPLSD